MLKQAIAAVYFNRIILFFLSGFLINTAFSQSAQPGYPKEMKVNYSELARKAIASEKEMSPELAKVFYESLYESKSNFFLGNSIYFDNAYSRTVNTITDKLLKADPTLRNEVNVYVTRYTSRNAYSLSDGSIFINIGLLMAMESEAQIAFILGHEIGHYYKQHARKKVLKKSISSEETTDEDLDGDFFRRLKYSREAEFESDAYAISLMRQSNYAPKEAVRALEILSDSLDIVLTKEEISAMLSTEVFTMDTSKFKPYRVYRSDDDNDPIMAGDDDRMSTHPNIDKRILAVKELLDAFPEEYDKGVVFDHFNRDDFDKLRASCRNEVVDLFYRKAEYFSSLLIALEFLKQEKENDYMKVMIIKNLYQLAYYKEIESSDRITKMNSLGQSESLMALKGYVKAVTYEDLKKLLFGYTKSQHKKFEDEEEFLFYYALVTSNYLGGEPARILFEKYRMKFPSGKYIKFIDYKL